MSNYSPKQEMADVQNQADHRKIAIDKVGVKNIKYPITVQDKVNGHQNTVASINMYVDLPHQHKGTHMSRFIEVLAGHKHDISPENMPLILADIKKRLNAPSAYMDLSFPYFIDKVAPVSKAVALMEYTFTITGEINDHGCNLTVGVTVPITTLCPCSKEISRYGAHNQRGEVTVLVKFKKFFWIEDLITAVESSCSSQVYALLKRSDEKFVTEEAYENPKFVEDVVREIALKLQANDNYTWFSIEAENFESIHNHSAYAYLERHKNN